MRGFLSGLILGAIVAAAGVAVLSLMMPLPPGPDVAANAPAAATGAGTESPGAGMNPVGADADLVEAAPAAPGSDGTQPDDLNALDRADTEPADKPQVGGATSGLEGPVENGAAPELGEGSIAPVAPVAPAGAPAAPREEAGVSIATELAQPAVPDVPEAGSGFATAPPQTEPAPDVTTRTDPELAASGGSESVTEPGADSVPAADTAPAPATVPAPPQIAALPQADDGGSGPQRPTVGTPVVPLTERDNPAPPQTEAQGAPAIPPIERFAVPFENPEERPLMSILLIDDENAIGVEALQDFPYPLSFAVDPQAPDAAEKMARHRAAGFEVVLLTDLPAAATAQDAEVALSVWRETVPEAVAIMEGTGTGIQGNRALSDQVTAIASSTGMGLITQSNGLNTAQKLAARAGVPSAVVFRDFDGAGQTPTVMRRFLDQAAFRAGQEGAVIMLGRVRPDTISALLLWGLQDRASRVALAPVSAVLKQGQ